MSEQLTRFSDIQLTENQQNFISNTTCRSFENAHIRKNNPSPLLLCKNKQYPPGNHHASYL